MVRVLMGMRFFYIRIMVVIVPGLGIGMTMAVTVIKRMFEVLKKLGDGISYLIARPDSQKQWQMK